MTIMVCTGLTIILNTTGKVSSNEFVHITTAASNHLNTLSFKHILGTLTHISSQHDHNSHLPEHRSDTALAAASIRRSHLADSHDFTVDHIKNRIIGTMTKMVIQSPISSWYCYPHNLTLFFQYLFLMMPIH